MKDHFRPHHLQPQRHTIRVALVYRDLAGDGVSHIGLGVSAAYTSKTLRQHGIWAEDWPIQTSQKLAARLRDTQEHAEQYQVVRPTHVILSAPWMSTRELAELAAEFREIRFVVVSHSNVGFLASDAQAIERLRGIASLQLPTHNVFVGGNSLKFTSWATESWGVNVVWLPNLYNLEETFPHHHRSWSWRGGPLRLGLFGANRPLKNFLTSAAAVVTLARRLHVPVKLVLSSGRNEGGNFLALEQLTRHVPGLEVEHTGWLPWSEFRELLRSIDLVLQVSYTESFNVVAADAVAEGVPVVVSDAIDWLPEWWQANADEPLDVARVAERLLRDPDAPRHGREALQAYVERGLVGWLRFLCPTLSTVSAWR